MKKITVVLLSCMLFIAGCAQNPVTGKRQLMLLSMDDDSRLGKEYFEEIDKDNTESGLDQGIELYISGIGNSIVQVSHMPSLEFHFNVINDESVNAFALPGGYIFINIGMLRALETEAQLASVLAHEIVHVTARHSAASMSKQMAIDVLLSAVTTDKTASAVDIARIVANLEGLQYSKSHEREADIYGLDYLFKAGYDPQGMIEMMEVLGRQGGGSGIDFFSTHPSPENRLGYIQEKIYEKEYRGGKVGREEYSRNVLSKLGRV